MNQQTLQTVLSVRELSVTRGGNSILERVSFEIGQGEVVILTGDNGAGKTTLIKAILGLLPVSSGHIIVHGAAVGTRQWRRKRAAVGYVNQESISVEFPISAAEVVEIGMSMHKRRRDRRARIVAAMQQTGTIALANRDYRVLSGGEKQRVSIARCLAQNADILLLDEPQAFLDPDGRLEVLQTIGRLGESGVSVLLVSHHEAAPNNGTWRRLHLHHRSFSTASTAGGS